MKNAILFLCLMGSFLSGASQSPLRVVLMVEGAENRDVLKDGVRASDLTHLKIQINEGAIKVGEFDIIHARGQSPVSRATSVKGDAYDISNYRKAAKPGDRLVVTIKTLIGEGNAQVIAQDLHYTIPII